MFYFTSRDIRFTDSVPLFLLVACAGPVLSLFMAQATIQLPDAEVLLPVSVLAYGRLPIALSIPVVSEPIPEAAVIQPAAAVVPVVERVALEARLVIPRVGVDATIKQLGETPEGAMAVPDNGFDVSWYNLGTPIGETGSAVIGGHNRWNDASAVFERLDQLQIGDVVSVTNANGDLFSFVVRETRTYDPTDAADEIFTSASGVHLNLITCSGVFDPATGMYTKRLVIFTDLL